ncbi:paraquat-inducible protein B [Actimicrobium sp. GrIS 1.19]|uniref:PqiB family protein n=1 Tax=Actimicrobium sp. GrIS 1.19 TaxID=3071708 RepID=UPI002E07AF8C|nr:paraquat-inducible protein B [Actimicrobium sp. GrIS 1.19]
MTEPNDDIPRAQLPLAVQAPRWYWSPWLIWLIPVIAALIGGTILVQALLSRGPTITINFKNAEGLEAGKTRIKYKDVDIGTVGRISLSPDRKQVIVTAQLVKSADSFLREDTRFWVVRPRVGAGGISGLGTLLSGSYIGVDAGKSEEARTEFTGLDVPPFVLTGLAGRQFVLHADQIGSLDIGAPIFFRHIQVGQIAAYELDPNGTGVILHGFVNAPYDKYVTTNARFWQSSGVELSVDANGVKVNTESLAAILSGGVSFAAPADMPTTAEAAANAEFKLYPNRDAALKYEEAVVHKALLYFEDSVRGLSLGAPVDFRGIVIGEVTSIDLEYDKATGAMRFPVEVNLYPQRLQSRRRKSATETPPDDSPELLDKLVKRGLRAQLKSGNLLTGQLFVGLDFFPDAARTRIDWKQSPIVLPTVPGTLEELQSILSRIARRLDKVPMEQIAADLRTAMQSLDSTLKSTDKLVKRLDTELAPEMRATLEQVRKTVASADSVLASDAPLQQDLRETLRDVSRAAQALRSLTDYLDRHPESLIRGKKENP